MPSPSLPGMPPLLAGSAAPSSAPLLASDSPSVQNSLADTKWGIYKDGVLAISPDSIIGVDYRQDTKISDHPLEDGAFETYNKVGTPYEVRVRMAKGGTQADRTAFLRQCEALVNSFDVYDVVTPERTYINANLQRYDYSRSAKNGLGLITVEMTIIEIRRFAVATKLSATAQPAGADPVNKGRTQARAVTDFVGVIPDGNPKPSVTNFVGVFK